MTFIAQWRERNHVPEIGIEFEPAASRIVIRGRGLYPLNLYHARCVGSEVRGVLQDTPHELCTNPPEDGLTLAGTAATGLLAERIAEDRGFVVRAVDAPTDCVAQGLPAYLHSH